MLTLLKIFYLVLVYCHLPPLQDDIWFVLCWQRMIIFHWNLFIKWGGTIADSSCTMRMPDSHEFKSKMGGTKGTESHSAAVHGCSHCAYICGARHAPWFFKKRQATCIAQTTTYFSRCFPNTGDFIWIQKKALFLWGCKGRKMSQHSKMLS